MTPGCRNRLEGLDGRLRSFFERQCPVSPWPVGSQAGRSCGGESLALVEFPLTVRSRSTYRGTEGSGTSPLTPSWSRRSPPGSPTGHTVMSAP